ncbi:ciliary-associated calcium-binding coiled-coil protein 1 [Eucyclogobius newberryi]|uniref:ciliary-associated calcium-binding coiled-coil protein 1 n=1 Tax=Eucyclogobius newberryi TaxID=166745 RepID=UPI003B59D552
MSPEQLEAALGKSEQELTLLLSNKLGLTNSHVCMKEAALLHYYLQGLCWALDAHLSPLQMSFTMAVLDVLLHNITEKGMDFVDNVLEFAKALAVACQSPTPDKGPSPLLSLKEAQALIRFISSLFQNYLLYKALQISGREELLLCAQETVDVLWSQTDLAALEEGIATHLVTPDTSQ